MTESGSADSHIGSLISLTSKSGIRYEGILYTVDAENSNIALQNVRSFGTEGRKKDGPQIPASDKVFEYIIFRGTDIRDLQVKVSPRFSVHDDPAIISLQAQTSHPGSAARPNAPLPPVGFTGSASSYADVSSFNSPLPYNHASGSNMTLWAPPTAVLSRHSVGAADPTYWQGVYKTPTEEPPSIEHQLQQKIFPRTPQPPPSQTHASQVQSFTALSSPLSCSEALPVFSQTSTNSANLYDRLGTSQESTLLPSSSASSLMPPPPFKVSSELEATKISTLASSNSSCTQVSGALNPGNAVYKMERLEEEVPTTSVEVHLGASSNASHSRSRTKSSNAFRGVQRFGRITMASKQSSKELYKGVDLSRPECQTSGTKMQWAPMKPLLPLPISQAQQKPSLQTQNGLYEPRRGRGRGGGVIARGRGVRQPAKFLEVFDFAAMNEKFKKEEVWGELLKVEKDKVGISSNAGIPDQHIGLEGSYDDKSGFEFPRQAVYVKDEFFDSLSCELLDWGDGKVERSTYFEQRKTDSQTFGRFLLRSRGSFHAWRNRGGGRGFGRGRGYGYRVYNRGDRRPVPAS